MVIKRVFQLKIQCHWLIYMNNWLIGFNNLILLIWSIYWLDGFQSISVLARLRIIMLSSKDLILIWIREILLSILQGISNSVRNMQLYLGLILKIRLFMSSPIIKNQPFLRYFLSTTTLRRMKSAFPSTTSLSSTTKSIWTGTRLSMTSIAVANRS